MHEWTTATRRGCASLSLAILGSLAVASPGFGQISPRCSDAEYRELDFWVGEWVVRGPDGDVAGRSTIESIMDGCAIHEEWSSQNVRGTSLSMYDPGTDTWRQFWVDNRGVSLAQEGGWTGSAYQLRTARVGSDGRLRHIRMTLTPMTDGTIRQLQERSEDGGETWSVIFDGRYHPVETTGR